MKIYHIMFEEDWDCANYVLLAETEADAMLNLYNWMGKEYSDDNIKWWNKTVEHFRNATVEIKELNSVIDIHQSYD